MFETLLESRDHRRRPLGQTVTSVAVHAAIVLVVVREVHVAPAAPPASPDTSMVFIARPTPAPARPTGGASGIVSAPVGAPIARPAIDVPLQVRPVTLDASPFDPRAFAGHNAGADLLLGNAPAADSSALGSVVVTSADADEPPRLLAAGPLRAPTGLEGVQGRVVLSFVVDTLGRAEPASVKVVSSTGAAFHQAAREMVLRSRFASGRNGGRAVRVLVEQAVAFGGP